MNQAHGSPYDRGGADRYYGRPFRPHWHKHKEESINGEMKPCFREIKIENMTEQEILEYKKGWNSCVGRKDWGDGLYAPEQADVVE